MNEPPCSKPTIVEEEASNDDNDDAPVQQGLHRKPKRDSAIKDQQSTGRKRAAKQYPLYRDQPCEWAKATSESPMGGGKVPIPFGCDNLQQARHHGPDKNTLNNEPGNVHRICHWHHNNWHQLNDADYNWANAGKVLRD